MNDYWKPSQKLLGESVFMQRLLDYDKDNIPPPVIVQIKTYVANPDFLPAVIEKQSKAATGPNPETRIPKPSS